MSKIMAKIYKNNNKTTVIFLYLKLLAYIFPSLLYSHFIN